MSKGGIAERLRRRGLRVEQFNEYHHRVNGELDFWKNDKGKPWGWHDRVTDQRGTCHPENIWQFIVKRMRDELHTDKASFVLTLKKIGWSERDAVTEYERRERSQKETVHDATATGAT